MIKYSIEEVVKIYEENGNIMYQATLDGDYKANNKAGHKLIKIFKYFENNKDFALACITELIKSENVVIKTKAAAYCLALGENVALAEKILQEISDKEENGIFGFNAQMTLDVWKKQGYLQIYPKDKK